MYAACLVQFLSRTLLVHENSQYEDYRVCFYIFAGFNVVSLLLSLFVNYEYEEQLPSAKIEGK